MTTPYASLVTALEGYLAAAAATMTSPTCNDVLAGQPTKVPKACISYWFVGIRPWQSNTLGATEEEWGFTVRIYLPIGIRTAPPRKQAEEWLAVLTSAVRAQLAGHVSAGGYATGLGSEVTDAHAGELDVDGTTCRIVEMDWWAYMANVASIAP